MKLIDKFNLKTVKKALTLMGDLKKTFLTCIVLFCIVELLCTALEAYGMRGIINALTSKNVNMFWYSLCFIVIKNILWWCYAPISSYLCSESSIITMREYKTNFFEHILRLPMIYHDRKTTAEYLTQLTSQMEGLKKLYDWSFFQVLRSFTGGVGGVIIMMIIDYKFALVVIGFGFLSILLSSIFSEKLQKISEERQNNLTKATTDIYELVKASKTIRILNIQKEKERNVEDVLNVEKNIRQIFCSSIAKMKSYELLISKLSYVTLLIIGAIFVYFNLSDWGTITALLGLKYIADMLFVECGQFMSIMQRDIVAIDSLVEIQSVEEEKLQKNNSYSSEKLDKSMIINNLSFGYDNNDKVIDNLSLEILNNSFVALFGASGKGKSTLIKLIMGLYNPDSGSIIFNGDNNVTLSEVREKTSYVPQEPMLFNGTIYENIKFGNEYANFEDIVEASNIAGAQEFINDLDGKYDYVLNDDGNNLSGGQKKRIALARALVKNADILLLDEITSALDFATEEQVLQTIKEISRQKTVLFVTHNKNIVKYADRIVNI